MKLIGQAFYNLLHVGKHNLHVWPVVVPDKDRFFNAFLQQADYLAVDVFGPQVRCKNLPAILHVHLYPLQV